MPLGIGPDHQFREASIGFAGDTLLLYTDGIDEARSPSNEMFGIDGIKAIALGSSLRPFNSSQAFATP